MPRIGYKAKGYHQAWYMAICSVCINRRIKKTSENELNRIADKNKWQQYEYMGAITYICPDCVKKGYCFD